MIGAREIILFGGLLFFLCTCRKEEKFDYISRIIQPEGNSIAIYNSGSYDNVNNWGAPLVTLKFPPGAVAEQVVLDLKVLARGNYEVFHDISYNSVLPPDSINDRTHIVAESSLSDAYYYFICEDGSHLLPVSKFLYFEPRSTRLTKKAEVILAYHEPQQNYNNIDSIFMLPHGDCYSLGSSRFLKGQEGFFKLYYFDLNSSENKWKEASAYAVDTIANTVKFEIEDFSRIYGLGYIDVSPLRKDYFTIQASGAEDVLLQYTTQLDGGAYGIHTLNDCYKFFPCNYLTLHDNQILSYYSIHWQVPANQSGIVSQNTMFKIYRYEFASGIFPEIIETYTGENIPFEVNSLPAVGEQLEGSVSADLVSDLTGKTLHIDGHFNFTRTR